MVWGLSPQNKYDVCQIGFVRLRFFDTNKIYICVETESIVYSSHFIVWLFGLDSYRKVSGIILVSSVHRTVSTSTPIWYDWLENNTPNGWVIGLFDWIKSIHWQFFWCTTITLPANRLYYYRKKSIQKTNPSIIISQCGCGVGPNKIIIIHPFFL